MKRLATLTLAALLLTACGTTRTTTDTSHTIDTRLEHIESLLHQRTVIQQDSAWREQVLRQFQSIRERTDTSHTIIQDTAGNVVKETLIIRETRERDTQTYERIIEHLTHRLEQMDSTIAAQTHAIERLDSLAHREQQVKEVPAELTWWQQTRLHLANILLAALGIVAAIWIIRKKLKI